MGEVIGAWLRQRRGMNDWSQEQLAERLELSDSTVSRIERGVLTPDGRMARRIVRALGVPVTEILAAAACDLARDYLAGDEDEQQP